MTTVLNSPTVTLPDGSKLLESCDPCRRCPLYKGKRNCCIVGKTFDKHPNIQRLAMLVKEATSEKPRTLSEITVSVMQQTGNRMNFRRKKIIHAVLCVLHRLPEIQINKANPSKPLYYKESD